MSEPEPTPLRDFRVDQLAVRVYRDRAECGLAAARHVAARIEAALRRQPTVSICFGAAPSQDEFFAALADDPDLEWNRTVAFQIDEYTGISQDDPRALCHYMDRRLYNRCRPGQTLFFDVDAGNESAECRRYADLLRQWPLDIACLGIGESCHLAYNDPHVARFDDPDLVKVVEVDATSRVQQVHDGTAARIADAIPRAYTLTIPALMRAWHVSCVAPGKIKAAAVARVLREPVSEMCPATILRQHPHAVLFLDESSAAGAA